MTTIPNELMQRLIHTLLQSDSFYSSHELRSMFVDKRIALWRNRLPEANSSRSRVEQVIWYFIDKQNSHGENALVLLLEVLRDRTHPDDALHLELATLADNLKQEVLNKSNAKDVVSDDTAPLADNKSSSDASTSPIQSIKPKILMVDDEPYVVVAVEDRLKYEGYTVITASDGVEGLKKVHREKPELVILDIMMPKMNGYELCHHLKSSPETKEVPILMLTAKGSPTETVHGFDIGADDYLSKPFEMDVLIARVRALLRRTAQPPFQDTSAQKCLLSIRCEPEQRIGLHISQCASGDTSTRQPFHVDVDRYSRRANNAFGHDGHFTRKDLGEDIHALIFQAHVEVTQRYNQVLGMAQDDKNLHLRFKGMRDFLRVPLEFLFDPHQGDYLVLKHPFARSIVGKGIGMTTKKPLSAQFFNQLYLDGDTLRVLLIASNTGGAIAAADTEIEALRDTLYTQFATKRIPIDVDVITSNQATYEFVTNKIQKEDYHIIHYAGHATYDEDSPASSYLSFQAEKNSPEFSTEMSGSVLKRLFQDSKNLRFVYLSCCEGTVTGQPQNFLDNEFLGIADAIVHAGVPSTLGYRHPVEDSSAKALAIAFYTYLAQYGDIDTALLETRREIYSQSPEDPTWISPILIMQD